MRLRFWLPAIVTVSGAFAQPSPMVAPHSVVNSASIVPASIPGGWIAQGSIFSMYGTNLGPAQPLTQTGFPLSTQLGSFIVRVVQGTTVANAIPIYASPTRIDAIMPSTAPLGMVSIQVLNGVVRGNMAPARVTGASFGIYTANQIGFGPGQIQNINDDGSTTQNTAASPAVQGQTVTLSGTGLGAIAGDDSQPPADGDIPQATVEVFVGGESTTVVSNGRDPCCGGQDQITFQVPADALLGCYVPVLVRLNGTVPSNSATMAISSDGSACSDPGNPLSNAIINGGDLALAVALRSAIREDIGTKSPTDVISDNAALYLRTETGGSQAFNPVFSLPPPGSCMTLAGAGDWFTKGAIPGTAPGGGYFKGPANLAITGQGSSKIVPLGSPNGLAMLKIGSFVSTFAKVPSTIFLNPGNTYLTAAAAAPLGGISASLVMPAVPNWSNRDQVSPIDRTQDLTVTFDPVDPSLTVLIAGGAVDVPTYSTALFACVAPPGSNSFTVPAAVLSTLPASRPLPIDTKGILYVGTVSAPASFSPAGIDFGIGLAVALNGKTVIFQ